MKTARIWMLIAFAFLCLSQSIHAQTVSGWSDIWYDEGSQTVVADGITSLFGFSCCSPTTHMPYVEVQLDGPSGSAFDSYEGAWWEDAETSVWLDAAPGAFTVVSAHGVDVMGPDILMFSEVGYQSYLSDSGDFGSGGSDPDTLEWPGMVMLGDTRDSYTLCATPTNFHVNTVTRALDGTLVFEYIYSSSTGNPSDLAACTIGESVFYPNYPASSYIWPLPMVSSTENPFVRQGPATGGLIDHNYPPTSFDTPYKDAGFDARQRLWWHCPCYANNDLQYFGDDIIITRSVFKDTDNYWKYRITKSGYVNTIRLPGQ